MLVVSGSPCVLVVSGSPCVLVVSGSPCVLVALTLVAGRSISVVQLLLEPHLASNSII